MAETIFAQATPPGRSGIAVIRISGPEAARAARALGAGDPPPRRAVLRRLSDPRDGGILDDAIVLRFAAPASFTGEDSVEFQLHGGPAVCRAVAAALAALPGLRHAEAGEFTRRALANGRIDLAQVEGVADLLAAETTAQARQSLALMDGRLSRRAAGWRDGIVQALARIEAFIDFADQDIPPGAMEAASTALRLVAGDIAAELAGAAAAERIRLGFEVALVGAPNVGKSTLLNTIAGREAAITSELAGTTRDVIEVRLELAGLPVTLIDLAGMREARDPIEAIGVDRAIGRASAADLRVYLVEDDGSPPAIGPPPQPGDVVALAKSDLRLASPRLAVSGLTGAGVDTLVSRIADVLSQRAAGATLAGHERQQVALERALASLRAAAERLEHGPDLPELAAADLHAALRALDALVGKVDVEAVLDAVFATFCIGK
jgi:tRNA modification GTPase